eukprot:c22077_g1_i1 orf=585-1526(-)
MAMAMAMASPLTLFLQWSMPTSQAFIRLSTPAACRSFTFCCWTRLPRQYVHRHAAFGRGRKWHYNPCLRHSRQLTNVTVESNMLYSGKQVRVTEPLHKYILAHTREPQILGELREETSNMVGSEMQVSPEQGQFLAMLVQLIRAERCVEVGVYTGYSSLAVALVLPDSGHLVACEKDEISLGIAQKYYKRAGVTHKVDVRQGLALNTLRDLIQDDKANSFDFAFLDADKRKYKEYYELLLELVRPGGLVVIDNVLWYGKVADLQENERRTQSLREFNSFVLCDERVSISMVPIGDGMTLCRKRDSKSCPHTMT